VDSGTFLDRPFPPVPDNSLLPSTGYRRLGTPAGQLPVVAFRLEDRSRSTLTFFFVTIVVSSLSPPPVAKA